MKKKSTVDPVDPSPKKPRGAPIKQVDWKLFEQLCAVQCTQSEIASMLKIHPETLSIKAKKQYGEDYTSVNKRYSEDGKCSLRRHQFVQSKTNATMAIWLGKNWLGQVDKSEVEREKELEFRKRQIDYEYNIFKRIEKLESALLAKESQNLGPDGTNINTIKPPDDKPTSQLHPTDIPDAGVDGPRE